jgi:hypothetical protein
LRDPVDRVISTYYFWRHHAPLSPQSPWLYFAQAKSFDGFVRSDNYFVRQGIENLETWQLADDLRWRYHTVPEQDVLAVAKENLDKFDFIGLCEEFEDSVQRFCRYLGADPPRVPPHELKTKIRKAPSEISASTIEIIKERNRADIELYEYARKKVHGSAVSGMITASERETIPPLTAVGRPEPRMSPMPAVLASRLRVHVLECPAACSRGDILEIAVEINNSGDQLWSSRPPNPLFVSYHWLSGDGETHIFEGWRSELRPDLQPFATERYHVHVLAPDTPGVYTVRVTLVQEHVCWFDVPPLTCFEDALIVVEDRLPADIVQPDQYFPPGG